jgi:hypothetical protein
MDRKRKNIPARVRWSVFQRDDFRCVYCGVARKDGANLVIDHGDPFSKGGADDPSNFVTACKECNDGKRAKEFLPKAACDSSVVEGDEAVVRRGVAYKNQLHADWGEVFRHCCFSVEYLATSEGERTLRTVKELGFDDDDGNDRSSVIRIDFRCEMFNHLTVGTVNVVILPNCDRGCFRPDQKLRARDAVILGYNEPTAIIIGSPWMFYGAVVNDRYKGSPGGFKLDGWLNRADDDIGYGWCPDETWEFKDPRDEFSLKPTAIEFRGWHMTPAEGFALAEREVQHGL